MNSKLREPDWKRVDLLIKLALEEDLGDAGDVTSKSVINADAKAKAQFISKEDCVCAGIEVAERVFKTLDPAIVWKAHVQDGDPCPKGTLMAEVSGNAQILLTAERTALNFIQRLCGIATASKRYSTIAAENGTTTILDTRKTTPGWRMLEKYAVAVGGSMNHRLALYDMVMIKDNHREIAGFEGPDGIARSVKRAREAYPHLQVEVEADSLDEVRQALAAKADYIMLDNMSDETMAEAIKIVKGAAKLEASGGITLPRIASISKLGVDFISIGALTHSVKSADISMDIYPEKG